MKIKVTQKHIDTGDIGSRTLCPIALAIKYEFRKSQRSIALVRVYDKLCFINDLHFSMPKEATEFIRAFDTKEHVEPFEFELSDL